MDAKPEKSGVLRLPDDQIYADPSWAGEGTIVAVIGPTEGDTLALIDVSDPSRPRVKEVLWRKANGPDVLPSYPIYSATTRRCIFVGTGAEGQALYSVDRGKAGPAKRVEPEGYDHVITSLSFSPDGRYLLFSCDGPDRRVSGPAAGGRDDAKKDGPPPGAAGRGRKGEIYVTGQAEAGRGVSLIAIDPANREYRVVVEDCSARARISPDGRRVAHSKADALWVQGLDRGAEPVRVVDLAGATSGSPAAWSPTVSSSSSASDATTISFRAGCTPPCASTSMARTGRSSRSPPEDNVQDWSADGRWLLTASSRNAKIGWQLYVMRPDGTAAATDHRGRKSVLCPVLTRRPPRAVYRRCPRRPIRDLGRRCRRQERPPGPPHRSKDGKFGLLVPGREANRRRDQPPECESAGGSRFAAPPTCRG